jgi:hypothetical protein
MLHLTHKRKKGQELSQEQKDENRETGKGRIGIEHIMSGLKRYHILKDRTRMRDFVLYNQIIGVCAALWNYSKNI